MTRLCDGLQNQTLVEMAKGNPQWPQAFYPMTYPIDIHPGDLVHARCTFDSTGRDRTTHIGTYPPRGCVRVGEGHGV